ncbi:MAG: hypothetical protein K0Q53_1509 [Massilibacillus sp.]|nr:hypothetical protein [Massilibacillus sp.]
MKKFFALLVCISAFALAFFLLSPPAKTNGTIHVIAEATTNQKMIDDTKKTTTFFKQFLAEDMHIELTRDVKIVICPTKESYNTVLQRDIHLSKDNALRQAKLSAGISNDKFHTIALNGTAEKMKTPQNSTSAIAHELFHQVQAQLSNNKDDKALYWLKEGTADFIGATIAEKNGYQSREQWKLDTINTLRTAASYTSASDILHIDLEEWTNLMEQNQFPYQMSDLMVCYLVSEQPNDKAYASIAEYFRLVDRLGDGDKAFEQAFGLPINQFLLNFQHWFLTTMSQPAQIEIVRQPEIAPDAAADVEHGAALTRQFFQNKWNSDLKASQRIVLTGNKDTYTSTIAKEFNFSTEDAAQKSQSSVWWGNNSTTVVDMSSLSTKHQIIFATATIMVKRFQLQVASQKSLSTLSWLTNGSADVIAAHTVEMAGIYTLENYKTSWRNSLRNSAVIPNLAELQTEKDWTNANTKYGFNTVSHLSALAVASLIEKYGFESIHAWLEATKEYGDAEKAFQSVYGISSAQFAVDYKKSLTRQLK